MTSVNIDITKLVTYDVELPNRSQLVLARVVSWVAVIGSIVLAGWLAFLWFQSWIFWYSHNESPALVDWLIVLVVLIPGIVFATKFGKKYRKYFTVVRQGYVMDRDTQGGGGYDTAPSLTWHLELYGYTYANELTTYMCMVSAGDWADYKKGDLIDFR